MPPITLSSKTLVHISSGLYRSTANALKELVSNAFDADATRVTINTNYPAFDRLTCSDDGRGIAQDDFLRLMNGGIGNSLKRRGDTREQQYTPGGRPIVGRIGIGLLSIAQLCYQFRVISHHRESQTAFEAVLDLSPHRLREIQTDTPRDDYQVGHYEVRSVPYEASRNGVLVVTDDLQDTYQQRYRDDIARPEFQKVPLKFLRIVEESHRHRSIRDLGDYWRIFWELAVACPVRYLDDGPIRAENLVNALAEDRRPSAREVSRVLDELVARPGRFGFEVFLDGVPIRKPVLFPAREGWDAPTRVTPVSYDSKVRGSRLRFSGYIYSQTSAIYPGELRGLLIRVRNVAIGDYDVSCLMYEKVEGMRFNWISGEIYVDEGLEDALNIDRHSFNEVHPHYLALQKEVHRILSEGRVFAEVRDAGEAAKRSTLADNDELTSQYGKQVSDIVGKNISIERMPGGGPNHPLIKVDAETGVVRVFDSTAWPRRKQERIVAEKVVLAYELGRAFASDALSSDDMVILILRKVFQG